MDLIILLIISLVVFGGGVVPNSPYYGYSWQPVIAILVLFVLLRYVLHLI